MKINLYPSREALVNRSVVITGIAALALTACGNSNIDGPSKYLCHEVESFTAQPVDGSLESLFKGSGATDEARQYGEAEELLLFLNHEAHHLSDESSDSAIQFPDELVIDLTGSVSSSSFPVIGGSKYEIPTKCERIED